MNKNYLKRIFPNYVPGFLNESVPRDGGYSVDMGDNGTELVIRSNEDPTRCLRVATIPEIRGFGGEHVALRMTKETDDKKKLENAAYLTAQKIDIGKNSKKCRAWLEEGKII